MLDVVRPALQRGRHGALIAGTIVNTTNAGTVAAEVIQHRFDVMRLDSDIGHTSRDSSTDVVKFPDGFHCIGNPLVESLFALPPISKADFSAIAKQMIPRIPQYGPDDIQRR